MQQTSDGGFILAGSSESGSSGDKTNGVNGPSDFWTVKLDASGTKIWDKTVGGSTQDNANALQVLPNEAFVVGGSSNSRFGYDKTQASRGNFDFWFAKMRSSCANLAAELIPACTNGIGTLTVKVSRLNNAPWTLKYSIGGVEQSITQTSPEVVLATAPPPGTVFLLKSLTFSGCTKSLNQAFAFPSVQNELTVISEKSCWPEPVVLAVKGAPSGHKYSWYTVPTGGSPVWQDSTGRYTISGLQTPVIYYVAASNKLGCEGPRMQVLARPNTCEVFIPNIISSNQDGKNDTFQPQNLTSGKWSLQVFNRWGKKIFETEDYQNTWPENNVTAGTYFYKLQHLETGQKYKGWLEVVR